MGIADSKPELFIGEFISGRAFRAKPMRPQKKSKPKPRPKKKAGDLVKQLVKASAAAHEVVHDLHSQKDVNIAKMKMDMRE